VAGTEAGTETEYEHKYGYPGTEGCRVGTELDPHTARSHHLAVYKEV